MRRSFLAIVLGAALFDSPVRYTGTRRQPHKKPLTKKQKNIRRQNKAARKQRKQSKK